MSYLELLRVPYTGCNPRGLLLSRDKSLSKKLMAYHRIPVPDFSVFRRGRKVLVPPRLKFPLIVKSLTQESSIGISQASVVGDEEKLRKRVEFIHESVGTHAIAERYIDGRELYVGVLGNERLQVFPVWEMHFKKMVEGDNWPIATERVKWSTKYQEKHGIATDKAQALPEGFEQAVGKMAKRVYRALELTGYARIDLRMDSDGKPYVLEANPNPQIAYGEDFAESAEHSGHEVRGLARPHPGARAAVEAGASRVELRLQIDDCRITGDTERLMEDSLQSGNPVALRSTNSSTSTGATPRFARCSARPSTRCSRGATRWSCCRPAAASRSASSCRRW